MFSLKKILYFIILPILYVNFNFAAESKFHAVYDCAYDADTDTIFISKAVISKNGAVIVFYGWNSHNKPVLYKMQSNGSGLLKFTLPDYINDNILGIQDITISGDGSVAYLYSGFRIYKIVENVITEIFNSEESDDINQFSNLQTTADGMVVFFQLNGDFRYGSVWQLDIEGLQTIKVIDPEDILRNDMTMKGAGLSTYARADNGFIAFILRGYWNDDNQFVSKPEIFLRNGTLSYKQLTFNSEALNTGWLDISGNGQHVLHHKKSSTDTLCYFTVDSSGLYQTKLANIDIPGRKDMNFDGSYIFLRDSRSQGRLIYSNGLITEFDIIPQSLGVDSRIDVSLSYDRKVCVVCNNKGKAGVYVGYLDVSDAHLGNPVISNISFDPRTFPRNNADATIKLLAEIINPQGSGTIDEVDIDILYNGINMNQGYSYSQVWFPKNPNDAGTYADETAGDGIYTTEGKATPEFENSDKFHDQVYVRLVTHNTEKDYALYDVLLELKYATDIDGNVSAVRPALYSLSQNYPNPFNPNTTIKYTIPQANHVTLKIYDAQGKEICVLVNKKKIAGNYEVEYIADNLASGIYYYRLQAGDFSDTKKFILLK
jgi:hypothetical protein